MIARSVRRVSEMSLVRAVAAVIASTPPSAYSATWQWDEVVGAWSVGANWNTNTVPMSASDTSLIFGASGTANYIATHDLISPFTLNSLTFQSASSGEIRLNGNALRFVLNGAAAPQMVQNASGVVKLEMGINAQAPIHLTGTGTGIVGLHGVVEGAGSLDVTTGHWQLRNAGNSFSGGLNIRGGTVEIIPTIGATNVTRSSTSFLGASTSGLTLNGGTLKLTSKGVINSAGTGGHLAFGTGFGVNFDVNGGTMDLRNSNPQMPGAHAGSIGYGAAVESAGGDLAVTLNNILPAVIQFNGGEVGLSGFQNPLNGDWRADENALRFSSLTGTGALRIELSNGALTRAGTGKTGTFAVSAPTTYRGVQGGDPTSGVNGTVNSSLSQNTGRVMFDRSQVNFSGSIVFEDTLQVIAGNGASGINGSITLAGNASGHPATVAFAGRASGTTQMNQTFVAPTGAGTGQNVLWIGRGGNDVLTIEDGATGIFDARIRMDQQINHGVILDARAVLEGGGTLRIAQSLSNFSPIPGIVALANVGDITLRGDVEGKGSTLKDAVLDLRLPVPSASGTIANGVPQPISANPLGDNQRPFGGLNAEASHGIVINGSGFGGLRVEANARQNALFSTTGSAGGLAMPDPTSNLTKLQEYLTASRLSGITGASGYLTAAPQGQTWPFPVGGEWSNSAPVGLRVIDHYLGGVDVSLSGLASFQHNVAVDAGATLDLGNAPFAFGPTVIVPGIGTLNGLGTITSSGGLTVAAGGRIAPGLVGIGELTIQASQVNVEGAIEIDGSAVAADLLKVAGNLILTGTSQLSFPTGTILAPRSYKIAVANTRLGTFSAAVGLPSGFAVDYSRPDEIWLKYIAGRQVTWSGGTNGAWDKAAQNWKGPTAFMDTDSVLFDDTAPLSRRTVSVSGGNVSPNEIAVDTAGNYTLISNAGSAITGFGQLIKNGTGTLLLSGPASFEGGMTINAGAVQTLGAHSIPDVGKVRVATGAELNLAGAESVEHLMVSGSVSANAALSVGELSLNDAAVFSAPLVLQGTLSKSGGPLDLPGAIDLAGARRTIQVEAGVMPGLTLRGVVSNGGILKKGVGMLVLDATNTFADGMLIEAGTVRTDLAGTLPVNGAVTIRTGGALNLNGRDQSIGALISDGMIQTNGASLTVASLAGAGGSLNLGSGALAVVQAGTTRYDGAISGTGSVVKTGFGSLGMSGNNTFSGGLNVLEGSVRILTNQAAGTNPVNVAASGSLVAAAWISAPVILSGGTFGSRIPGQDFPATVADVTAASGTISTILLADPDEPTVPSEVILDGALRGSGDIFVQAGINNPKADSSPGFRLRGTGASDFSGVITVGNGSKLELQSEVGGTFSPAGTGRIVMNAGTHGSDREGTYSQLTLRNQLGQPVTLGNNVEVTGIGLVSLNPVTSLTLDEIGLESNLRVIMGNLRVADGQIIAVNKNQPPGQTLEFTTVTLTGGEVVLSPTTPGFGFGENADLVLGAISETVPGSGITMDGDGSLTLLGGNSYSGPTRILRGTTLLAGVSALPAGTALHVDGGKIDFQNGADVSFSQTVSELSGSAGTITNSTESPNDVKDFVIDQDTDTMFEGNIEGKLNVVKQGSGTLRLVGANTHGGTTTIAAGTLSVSGNFVEGSIRGPVLVQSGATLSGYGGVGDLTVAGGGHVSPGNSPGILTTGALDLQDGAVLEFELNGKTEGSGYDQLDVFGTVTMTGLIPVDLQLVFDPVDHVDALTLILNNGIEPINGGGRFVYGDNTLENGEVFTLSGPIPQPFKIHYDGNDGNDVVLMAVPEPSVTVLLLGGVGLFTRRRRFR